jgi:hypothetical protein
VETEPALRLGKPEVLFTREADTGTMILGWPDAFDVTAEGERFLVVRPVAPEQATDTPPGLIVAQNWFAEFTK